VPLLDVIDIPDTRQRLMVMPFLRSFNNPRFQTFGEFVAFFTQISEVNSLGNVSTNHQPILINFGSGSPIHASEKHRTQVRIFASRKEPFFESIFIFKGLHGE
jgi:hypothetical protein